MMTGSLPSIATRVRADGASHAKAVAIAGFRMTIARVRHVREYSNQPGRKTEIFRSVAYES